MKKLLHYFTLTILISPVLSSCFSLHSGMITGTACLTSNNFTIVARDLRGSSQTFFFAGCGGWSVEGMVSAAKKNLLSKHELKKNQALANVTVDFKTSVYLGIAMTRECIVTADIVEFN